MAPTPSRVCVLDYRGGQFRHPVPQSFRENSISSVINLLPLTDKSACCAGGLRDSSDLRSTFGSAHCSHTATAMCARQGGGKANRNWSAVSSPPLPRRSPSPKSSNGCLARLRPSPIGEGMDYEEVGVMSWRSVRNKYLLIVPVIVRPFS